VRTQMLAAALSIRFLWLPKQAPELNAMDQLWRCQATPRFTRYGDTRIYETVRVPRW